MTLSDADVPFPTDSSTNTNYTRTYTYDTAGNQQRLHNGYHGQRPGGTAILIAVKSSIYSTKPSMVSMRGGKPCSKNSYAVMPY